MCISKNSFNDFLKTPNRNSFLDVFFGCNRRLLLKTDEGLNLVGFGSGSIKNGSNEFFLKLDAHVSF